MIKVTIKDEHYNELSFEFEDMKRACNFIKESMDNATDKLTFGIEKVEPLKNDENGKTFEDVLAEGEE